MPTQETPFLKPVEDTVPKVDNNIAVGEDLRFQHRWWTFERCIWLFFLLILVADALGLFGRGWLAKAQRSTPDNALTVKYERIERASTPSIMTIRLAPSAIQNGAAHIFLSNSIIDKLRAPLFFGFLINTNSRLNVSLGWALGSVLMLIAATVEYFIGVEAAGKSLESISKPLQSR